MSLLKTLTQQHQKLPIGTTSTYEIKYNKSNIQKVHGSSVKIVQTCHYLNEKIHT